MFRLLVLAFVVVGATGGHDLAAHQPVPPLHVFSLDEMHDHEGHHVKKPHLLNVKEVHGKKADSKTDRIVTDFLNPDYVEPITVLDYRYLKTGGRDYTRDAGGQILILPKGVRIDVKKEFENFDKMLEYLWHKQLAEHEASHKKMRSLGHTEYLKHHIQITGDHGPKHFTAEASESAGKENAKKTNIHKTF